MTADMRAHGVGREMKDDGDVPGGLAFHTKVINCNFVLRFHVLDLLSMWWESNHGGYSPVMVIMPLPQGT